MIEYLDYLEIKKYKKSELVFEEGTNCDKIGILVKGELKITTLTLLEETFTIDTIHEGEMFGENLIFSEASSYLGNCEATKESRVAFVKKDDLLTMFRKDKQILLNYLKLVSTERLKVQERLKIFSQKNIKEKILFLVKTKMDKYKTFYFYSKQELAEYLNIPRPSLSRALIEMKDEGILDFDKHTISLKKDE